MTIDNEKSVADPDGFDRVVHEIYQSLERNEAVGADRFIARYPHYESQLQSFFADLRMVDANLVQGSLDRTDHDHSRSVVPPPVEADVRRHITYVGQYRILDEIGRGGMGVVFKARQEKLKRIVALKMILAGRFAGPNAIERFYREARAAAGLQHPNIVGVHEIGMHEGHHYFTMDYFDCDSLSERLRNGSLAPREACELVETLARATAYAHANGVLHRDLKPGNVLIDRSGQPHITDFGLAKPVENMADQTINEITQSGQIIGTPSYMAPEQAAAKHGLVSFASDVYSLGAILYTCLTGRAPFVAESTAETLRQVMDAEVVPVVTLNPRVPKDLDTICQKCLQKEPNDRYPSASALADDLNRFRNRLPIQARPASPVYKAWKWCRRRPDVAGLMCALTVAIVIGFSSVAFWWKEAEGRQIQAEEAAAEAKANLVAAHLRAAEAIRSSRQSGYQPAVFKQLLDATEIEGVEPDWEIIRRNAVACLGDFVGVPPTTIEGPVLSGSPGAAIFLDEERIAAADSGGDVFVREIRSGNESSRLFRKGEAIVAMDRANQGRTLVLADRRAVERWDHVDDVWMKRWSIPAAYTSFFQDLEIAGGQVAVIQNREIGLLDLQSGKAIDSFSVPGYSFRYPDKGFLSVAITPDGKLVAAADRPEEVFLWEVGKNNALPGKIRAPGSGIPDLKFSSNGEKLVIGSDEGFSVFERSSLDPCTSVQLDAVRSLAIGPNGRNLLFQTTDGSVQLWNLITQRPLAEFQHPGTSVWGKVSFSPEGTMMLSSAAGRIRIWYLDRTPEKQRLAGHSRPVGDVVFHPHLDLLASCSHDGIIRFWDYKNRVLQTQLDVDARVKAIQFSSSGEYFAAATVERLLVWRREADGWTKVHEVNEGHKAFEDFSFSLDSRWIAACGNSGIRLYRLDATHSVAPVRSLYHFASVGKNIVFDASSRFVVFRRPNRIGWIDLQEQPCRVREKENWSIASDLVPWTASNEVIAVSQAGTIDLWNLSDGTIESLMEIGQGALRSPLISVNPRDELAVVKASGSNLALLNIRDGRLEFEFGREHAPITATAWSPDYRRIAVGLADGEVAVWDLYRVVARLQRSNLWGDLTLFPPESLTVADTWVPPDDPVDLRWEAPTSDLLLQRRLHQFLAETSLEPGDNGTAGSNPPTQPLATGIAALVERTLRDYQGFAGRAGAVALAIDQANLGPTIAQLDSVGYDVASLRPYQRDGNTFFAVCWWPESESVAKWSMTQEEMERYNSEYLSKGFHLVDAGGYLTPISETVRFYGVWREGEQRDRVQKLVLSVPSSDARKLFNELMNDYEPVLRQRYADSSGTIFHCELWERFHTDNQHGWFAYAQSWNAFQRQMKIDAVDRLPCQYIQGVRIGTSAEMSGIWRSDRHNVRVFPLYRISASELANMAPRLLRSSRPCHCNVLPATEPGEDDWIAMVWEDDRN